MENYPRGITIIAIVEILIGLLALCAGILSLGVAGVNAFTTADAPQSTINALAISRLVLAVAFLAMGYGLKDAKPWAWWGTLIVVVLVVIDEIIFGLLGGLPNYLGILIGIGIAIYLLMPGVRKAVLG